MKVANINKIIITNKNYKKIRVKIFKMIIINIKNNKIIKNKLVMMMKIIFNIKKNKIKVIMTAIKVIIRIKIDKIFNLIKKSLLFQEFSTNNNNIKCKCLPVDFRAIQIRALTDK